MNRRRLVTGALAATALAATPARAQDPSAGDVRFDPDISYGEVDGQPLLMDVFRPPEGDRHHPAVLLLHGVSTRGVPYPTAKDMGAEAAQLAAAGFVTCAVNFRLFDLETGANPWPVALDDAQLAVRWIRANASTYGIDPKRIGAYGHSTGAHLAALLGCRDTTETAHPAHADLSSQVGCVVSLAGEMDMTIPYPDEVTGTAMASYMGGTAAERPDEYRAASPVAWVDDATAPMLLQHGAPDAIVPIEHTHRMEAALRAAGVEVVTAEYPRFRHEGVRNYKFTGGLSRAFLERHLEP